MARITDFPCELINYVLRNLDNPRDLYSCLRTCRLFHLCYQQNPRLVIEIVKRLVPPEILPQSIVMSEIFVQPSTLPPLTHKEAFLYLEEDPSK
ncbi:hypothetical protein GGR57DRAFT_479999 [Xylariaceae sp. FL1272]|nr:hypothetical protein GGR57DRAFT_479999 [Xylariaceae sp. FL1272]